VTLENSPMNASTQNQTHLAANAARPRFNPVFDVPTLKVPPGKALGSVLAVAPAADRGLWILNQATVQPNVRGSSWLPSVVRFDSEGNFATAWGGPEHIPPINGVCQWPDGLEGLEVDGDGNLWVFGYKPGDDAVLKFSPAGELLLQLGQRGMPGNDDSRTHLGRPTSAYHNTATREVFISDGYANHRVIAFNSDSGEFTRMWGAYGKRPSALDAAEGFGNPVHKVAAGPDGRIYVADRIKNRVQEFELVAGGARFLREVIIAPGTMLFGSAFDIAFAPGGGFMYVADGSNRRIWIVGLASFEVLGWVAGLEDVEGDINLPTHYGLIHRFSVDSEGNLLLACVARGVKRLIFKGIR
jgi:DNA-binding beta-propeller fold protein YncE